MKKTRILALTLCSLTALSALGATACGKESKGVVKDVKTLNVAMCNAGYGSAWINELKEKFELVYRDEGYKINILEPRNNLTGATALSEMRLGTQTGVDLYLTAGVTAEDVTDEEYGVCAEKLNDLYDKGAINFDGSVDETPIKEYAANYKGWVAIGDDYYDYFYFSSPFGVVANVKVLADYGITELPRTTDELFDCYDAIYNGANGKPDSKTSGIYPTTWGGDNAAGYAPNSLLVHIAQMMGNEAYEEFTTMNAVAEDPDMLANGYTMYENTDLKDALEVFARQYDVMYSTKGSETQKHDVAHSRLVTGKAVFMTDGEFFFNEVKANFTSKLNDITFMNVPVISKLGVKLKLDGSGADAAKCDDILSYMIQLVDEGKDNATVKASTQTQFSVTLTDEQVQRVVDARKVVPMSLESDSYIVKGSPKKDIAELFLRMMASKDAANVMSKYAMGSAYHSADPQADEYRFIQDAHKVWSSSTYRIARNNKLGTVRKKINMFAIPGKTTAIVVDMMAAMGIEANEDITTRDYAYWANKFYEDAKSEARSKWTWYLERGGYTVNG